jgi:hypothetical protein
MGTLIDFAMVLVVLWSFIAIVVRRFVQPRNRRDQRLYEFFILLAVLSELPSFSLAWDEGTDLIARRMDIYVEARQDFQQSGTAKAALGGSLQIGWPIENAVDISGDNGSAELSIPVRGANGLANLGASGIKKDGVWKIVDLHLTPYGTKENIQIEH